MPTGDDLRLIQLELLQKIDDFVRCANELPVKNLLCGRCQPGLVQFQDSGRQLMEHLMFGQKVMVLGK